MENKNLTDLELQALKAITYSDFYENGRESILWDFSVYNCCPFNGKTRSGVFSSLVQKGLINIQFAIKNDTAYVIEANPRASRTVPFIAKAYDEPYVNYATKVMLGENKLKDFNFKPKLDGYAIKQPVFSFNKFPDVNKQLGPEMKSTGESILFIDDLNDESFFIW